MRLLTPDLYLDNICMVTPELLRTRGIKALILDVDNTLTEHNSQHISEEVLFWIRLMRQNGFLLMIASNNNKARIAPFAKKIEIEAVANSFKPLPIGYRKALAKWGLPAKEVAVVGDQIYTDIVGANLCGMFSILVKFWKEEKNFFFRLKRWIERPVIRRYQRLGTRKIPVKGENDQ